MILPSLYVLVPFYFTYLIPCDGIKHSTYWYLACSKKTSAQLQSKAGFILVHSENASRYPML